MRTTPALGSTSRFTILSVVVLPQPERPSSTSSSPRATSKLRRSTASVAPKRRVSSRTSIRGPFTRRTLPHGVGGPGPGGRRGLALLTDQVRRPLGSDPRGVQRLAGQHEAVAGAERVVLPLDLEEQAPAHHPQALV